MAAKLRGVFHERRVGHGGTLDPMATGVLPIFIGRATRAAEFLESAEKEYIAGLRLGTVTDTQDTSGTVLETHPVTVTRADVQAALQRFLGPIEQIPPCIPPLKSTARSSMSWPRRGKEVERKPRQHHHPRAGAAGRGGDGVCSSRPLLQGDVCAHALPRSGQRARLRRLYVVPAPDTAGSFTLSQAVTMQQVLDFAAEHDPQELLMPVDAVFSVHPPLIVTLGQAAKLKNGAQVRDWQFRPGTYRVYAEDGEFLLLGRVENGLLTTIKSFFEVNTLAT